MKDLRYVRYLVLGVLVLGLAGCGVSKNKYEALLNEKIALEEKVSVLAKARDALKNEYDNLLKEKMDLATKVETANNEKAALKSEYNKILDEKIALKAAYDKLLADSKEAKPKAR
jgi:transcriptional regulator with XRE-family HTH domain